MFFNFFFNLVKKQKRKRTPKVSIYGLEEPCFVSDAHQSRTSQNIPLLDARWHYVRNSALKYYNLLTTPPSRDSSSEEVVVVNRQTRREALTTFAMLATVPGVASAQNAELSRREPVDETPGTEHQQFAEFLKESFELAPAFDPPMTKSQTVIPLGFISAKASAHGWTDEDVDHHIELLLRAGRVYKPCVGWLASTDWL